MSVGQDIYRELQQRIRSGAIAEKLPSTAELMREFNVSSGTIKLAVERLKQQQLVYGVHGKGVFTNRVVLRKAAGRVLVHVPVATLRNHFYAQTLHELKLLLEAEGVELELSSQLGPGATGRYMAIVLIESVMSPDEVRTLMAQSQLTGMVALNYKYEKIPMVGSNNRRGGFMALTGFYERNHRDIGVLTQHLDEPWSFFHDRAAAIADFRAAHPDVRVTEVHCDKGQPESVAAAKMLEMAPAATAFLAFTDVLALALLVAARDRGRSCPADFALIGYGNTDFCKFQMPPLASMDEQPALMAQQLKRAVMRVGAGEYEFADMLVDPLLVVRESLG